MLSVLHFARPLRHLLSPIAHHPNLTCGFWETVSFLNPWYLNLSRDILDPVPVCFMSLALVIPKGIPQIPSSTDRNLRYEMSLTDP